MKNELPFKTPQKPNKSPQVLDRLHTFSQMIVGHTSCHRFRGLPCKMYLPFKTRHKSDKPPPAFLPAPHFSKMFFGHISCDRCRGLPCKMTPFAKPDENQISAPRCRTCSQLFPKCSLGTFLVTGSGACLAK